MLNSFQLFLGLLLIIIIIPQTPTENIVLRKFNETGFFTNYKESKSFLTKLTWALILLFLLTTLILNFLI